MKKLLCLASLVASVAGLTGCLGAPVVPPYGIVYTNYKAPLDVDYDPTTIGGKDGYSQTESVLGLVAWGDASGAAAAEDAGIKTIHHADYEYFNVLGVYQRYRTVVYGE